MSVERSDNISGANGRASNDAKSSWFVSVPYSIASNPNEYKFTIIAHIILPFDMVNVVDDRSKPKNPNVQTHVTAFRVYPSFGDTKNNLRVIEFMGE